MTGEQLKFLRKFLNIPKKEIAKFMQILPRHLRYYESGNFKILKKHELLLKNALFGQKTWSKNHRKLGTSKIEKTISETQNQIEKLKQEIIELRKKRDDYYRAIDRAQDYIRNGLCYRSYFSKPQAKTLADLEARLKGIKREKIA